MQKKSRSYILRLLSCQDPHFDKRGNGGRGQRWYHSKERWWFLIGSPLWPLRHLWPPAAICYGMSQMLKSTAGGSIWGKILGGEVDWCKPNFNAIWETWGCRMLSSKSSAVWAQRTNVTDRQTDRLTDHGCNRWNRWPAMSPHIYQQTKTSNKHWTAFLFSMPSTSSGK